MICPAFAADPPAANDPDASDRRSDIPWIEPPGLYDRPEAFDPASEMISLGLRTLLRAFRPPGLRNRLC